MKNQIHFILILSIAIIFSGTTYGGHLYKEKEYQECWCSQVNGVTEHVLPDRTRVDCLTDNYAVEFDFAEKWAESIGQALYYSIMTKRKPGIVVIIENPKDERYLKRLKLVIEHLKLNIMVWTITPFDIEQNHH